MMDLIWIFGAVAVVAGATGYALGWSGGQRAEALALAKAARGETEWPAEDELQGVDKMWRVR